VSPDDAPAPVGRADQIRPAAATLALAAMCAVVFLLSGLTGTGASGSVPDLHLPGADALVVEGGVAPDAGERGGDDATRQRIVRPMWTAVLSLVVLTAIVPVRVAWRRRTGAEPRPDRAHPGRTQAVRPPPAAGVRLLA
jgi:hypothetical protein